MSGMLFLMFVQSLFQFGAKQGIWEGYYGDKNYLDMFFALSFYPVLGFVELLVIFYDLDCRILEF